MNNRIGLIGTVLALTIVASACSSTASVSGPPQGSSNAAGTGPLSSAKKQEIGAGYSDTLNRLYASTPGSRELVAKAAGVLVFPRVLAAGLVVGGEYGEGELRVGGNVSGYYRTTTGSLGLQIGAQSKALVFLFMTQDSLNKFQAGNGWAAGADASLAVLKVGANGAIDVNAARAPTVAFVMTNAGLMANLTLEGTRVTRIEGS